ncbi:Unknown protein, partial [Striga hermonthica]
SRCCPVARRTSSQSSTRNPRASHLPTAHSSARQCLSVPVLSPVSAAVARRVQQPQQASSARARCVQHATGYWPGRCRLPVQSTGSPVQTDWTGSVPCLNRFSSYMAPRREPDHPAPTQATVVAQFRDYHAEKFSGQGDPRIVDEWIQGLEFIFEVMDCPDRYRVVCAQLQLTGDARLWWNAYWSMRPGEKAGCTWDMLKELVREKYYPSYYRAEMERQFLALQQGTRTIDEYEREFTRLAAF